MTHTIEQQIKIIEQLRVMQELYKANYIHGTGILIAVNERSIHITPEFFDEISSGHLVNGKELSEFNYFEKSVVIDGVKYISLFDKPKEQ
jgi:hypothetical protein